MFVLQGSLAKRRSNGTIDSSFGINGYAADAGFSLYSAAMQPDGKIVVAGAGNIKYTYPDVQQSYFAVARYNTDGMML